MLESLTRDVVVRSLSGNATVKAAHLETIIIMFSLPENLSLRLRDFARLCKEINEGTPQECPKFRLVKYDG